MKSRKKIVLTFIYCIVVLLIIVTGFSLANSNLAKNSDNEYESNFSPTGDRTYVRLDRTANDKVDVYLEMADSTVIEESEKEKSGVSVASFQIGLDIQVDLERNENSAVNFQFDQELLNVNETYCKLRTTTKEPITETYSSSEGEEAPVTKTIGQKLHIFYVGTKELNDANKAEGIKIGTISFDNFENEETISITPDSQFTKIASINHGESEVNIQEEDTLSDLIINPEDSPVVNPETNETENQTANDITNNTTNETENTETDNNTTNNNESNPDTNNQEENGDNQSEGDELDSSVPKTGDIAIRLFATLMIVSLVGIVAILIIKKRKK